MLLYLHGETLIFTPKVRLCFHTHYLGCNTQNSGPSFQWVVSYIFCPSVYIRHIFREEGEKNRDGKDFAVGCQGKGMKIDEVMAGKATAQYFRACLSLQRIQVWVQRPVVAYNCVKLQSQCIQCSLLAFTGTRHILGAQTYMQAERPYTFKKRERKMVMKKKKSLWRRNWGVFFFPFWSRISLRCLSWNSE